MKGGFSLFTDDAAPLINITYVKLQKPNQSTQFINTAFVVSHHES